VNGLGTGKWEIWGSILLSDKDFSLFRIVKTGFGAQPSSCSIGKVVLFSGINLPGREADHSPALVPR